MTDIPDELVEKIATLHNGCTWPEHYHESHGEHWRGVARQIVELVQEYDLDDEPPVTYFIGKSPIDFPPAADWVPYDVSLAAVHAGVTVIDRSGPSPVERELTDAEVELLIKPRPRTKDSYDLGDLDDDGNLKR